MLTGILSLLGIGGSIAEKLAAAYQAKQNATTDQERIAADERIAALQAQASAQKSVDAWVRAIFALPIAAYFGKIFLWDKVLGWGATDALSPELSNVAMIVIGFYFLHSILKG